MKVTLRRKDLSNNKERLYLDIYNPDGGRVKRKRESLNLFIYKKPKDAIEKNHNKETLQLAESLKAKVQLEIQNGASGFSSKTQRKSNFIDYFEKLTEARKDSIGNYGNWDSTLKHLRNFFGDYMPFDAVNEDELERFKNHLIKKLSKNSASSYFAKVKAALNQAFDDKIINDNPSKRVKGVKAENPKREFLTEDELKKLFKTDCDMPMLKKAFLFSAMTGLRWSDVITLKWSDIYHDNNLGHYILYKQKKTQKNENLPINETAIQIIGDRKGDKDKVFSGLVYSAWMNIQLLKWVIKADIKKHITFHSARHSYATLLLTNEVDIYTVSKLLGHSEIKTTEIYTRVMDLKKINAVNKLAHIQFKIGKTHNDE